MTKIIIFTVAIAISSVAFANNYELKALKELEQYISNSTHLIERAQLLQNTNTRYSFSYDLLRQDLVEITQAISRFINNSINTQEPRKISPLTKNY